MARTTHNWRHAQLGFTLLLVLGTLTLMTIVAIHPPAPGAGSLPATPAHAQATAVQQGSTVSRPAHPSH
ncbi:MAG: hypothetical protein AAGI68_00710 [Planctomycetota bacterium]